jgi:hypothetical protein
MEAYAELVAKLAKAIQAAKEAGLDAEHIAAALNKLAELVESDG